jgi:hypothetical protein
VVTDNSRAGWYTIPPLQENKNRRLTPDPIPHQVQRRTQIISFVARCATPSTRKTGFYQVSKDAMGGRER